MSELGTKGKFRSWLAGQGLSYTRYTKLSIPEKLALYHKYQGKK